jgi:hypothetical protein
MKLGYIQSDYHGYIHRAFDMQRVDLKYTTQCYARDCIFGILAIPLIADVEMNIKRYVHFTIDFPVKDNICTQLNNSMAP